MNKSVLIRLNPEQHQIFEAIKKFLGLENDAEVVRYLINEFYKEKLKVEKSGVVPHVLTVENEKLQKEKESAVQ